jgi:hypothetical protein
MFDTIPIEVLFLILNYLPSLEAFLSVNRRLRSKALGHPSIEVRKECDARQWRGCCKFICESGCSGLLEYANISYFDYCYLGGCTSIEISNLLIKYNPTIDIEMLLYEFIREANLTLIVYYIDRYTKLITELAIRYDKIDIIKYIVSKGIKIAKGFIVMVESYDCYETIYKYLITLPDSAFCDDSLQDHR